MGFEDLSLGCSCWNCYPSEIVLLLQYYQEATEFFGDLRQISIWNDLLSEDLRHVWNVCD